MKRRLLLVSLSLAMSATASSCERHSPKLEVEVFYYLLDAMVNNGPPRIWALYRLPESAAPGRQFDDPINLLFAVRGGELVFQGLNGPHEPEKGTFSVAGKMAGFSPEDHTVEIVFDLFPIPANSESVTSTQYEEGITKFIFVYFTEDGRGHLKYDHWKISRRINRPPVRRK